MTPLSIVFSDPLAEFLGALPARGTFRYTYDDVVKLAGHSCPTVAGAFLMTAAAMRALYPGGTPVRGEIEVIVGGEHDGTSSGPMSQVFTFLTGAATDSGFAGLAERWRRRGLLRFDPSLAGRVRFRRLDDGTAVDIGYQPGRVPPSGELRSVMARALGEQASLDELARFRELWMARVGEILASDPARVLEVTSVVETR